MSSITSTSTTPIDSTVSASGCCGGPAPERAGACCAHDADIKAAGGTGCGCGSSAGSVLVPSKAAPARSGCCG